jgi:hypothetical protein
MLELFAPLLAIHHPHKMIRDNDSAYEWIPPSHARTIRATVRRPQPTTHAYDNHCWSAFNPLTAIFTADEHQRWSGWSEEVHVEKNYRQLVVIICLTSRGAYLMLVLLFYTEVSYLLLKTDIELLRFGSRVVLSFGCWLICPHNAKCLVFGSGSQ